MSRRIATPLALIGLLAAGPALAEIPNFTFVGVEGVGELDGKLDDDRLGTSVNATEHVINVEDCRVYSGGEADWMMRISPVPSDSRQYATAYAPPGQSCSTSNANPEPEDGKCYVEDKLKELSDPDIDIRVDFDELTGGDCDSNEEGTATIYVILEQPVTPTDIATEQIEVTVDLKPPSAPVIEEVTAGDGRFSVSWTDDINDPDEVEYTLYWDEVEFTDEALETVNSKTNIRDTSVSIESDDLVNDQTYYVRVAAVDAADNISRLSDTLTATPIETDDFWEHYKAAGGTDEGNFCFVATAAYGTPMSGELDTLRAFRDRVLLGSTGGRAFVAFYYRWGRFAAAWIADKPALRAVVRVLLVPLIWLAKLALWLSPLGLLLAAAAAAIALIWLRRRALAHILRDIPQEARR